MRPDIGSGAVGNPLFLSEALSRVCEGYCVRRIRAKQEQLRCTRDPSGPKSPRMMARSKYNFEAAPLPGF